MIRRRHRNRPAGNDPGPPLSTAAPAGGPSFHAALSHALIHDIDGGPGDSDPVPVPSVAGPDGESVPNDGTDVDGDGTSPGWEPDLLADEGVAPRPAPLVDGPDFWRRVARAEARADLLTVPAVAVTVVVGPLSAAVPVARACQQRHWTEACEVVMLGDQTAMSGEGSWTLVDDPEELVAAAAGEREGFPLLVVDGGSGPSAVAPVLAELRAAGAGLVRCALPGHPTDEDLATWTGQVGRPSVIDLVTPIDAGRLLALLERGEPIATVAGVDVTADLILALRLDAARRVTPDRGGSTP